MNSRTKIFPKRIKARIEARSILYTARKLSKLSDGVFVMGQGLVERYAFGQSNLHVGIASWIKSEDVITEEALEERLNAVGERKTLNLCIASRLEPMKGVGLGLEALDGLRSKSEELPTLSIYGQGPDYDRLVAQTNELRLDEVVRFRGTVPYGKPFFDAVARHDLMLLTNLNVEQPRVVFDSISQGVVPICPDREPYASLGLAPNCLYRSGDPKSLADTIARFFDKNALIETARKNLPLVREYTMDAMHRNRAQWIQGVLVRANP